MSRLAWNLVAMIIFIQLVYAAANKEKEQTKGNRTKGVLKVTKFSLKNNALNITEHKTNFTANGTATTGSTKNSTKAATNSTKVPEKSFAKVTSKQHEKEEGSAERQNAEEWTDDYENEDPESNEYGYHNDYYGGEGQGYEYSNTNGDEQGQGYQYNYDNSPMMEGQTYEYKGLPQEGGFPQGGFSQGDGFSQDGFSYQNPGEFATYADDNGPQFAGNYEKKTKTRKAKNAKQPKIGMKRLNQIRHKHNVAKAKKTVTTRKLAIEKTITTKKQALEEKIFRRTIMIGNRVCGSKKSTNIQARRDQIHLWHEDEDVFDKRDVQRHSESPASVHQTDNCCAGHNECSRVVPAKTSKYGYTNDIEYDVMGCSCDSKFRNCLKNANSYTADAVGHLYFNTLKIPCLTFEQDTAETKSDQPLSPQEPTNIVSVVPDAETERETVGGAQLIVSTRGISATKDQELLTNTKPRKETSEGEPVTHHSKEIKNDSDEDEPQERKKRRPNIINPNPSPNNPNPYGLKVRGVVTLPEEYFPKILMQN